MMKQEQPEKKFGMRVGARLAIALTLTAAAGGYFYWQKHREAPRTLSATEQTIQEQLNQEKANNRQIGRAHV